MAMIAMEETEVARREEEVRRRNDDMDDQRRKNRMVQEAVAAQIRTLQVLKNDIFIKGNL